MKGLILNKKVKKLNRIKALLLKLLLPALGGLVSLAMIVSPMANALSLTQQIQNLQSQNDQTQSQINSLVGQASSYQDAINQLQAQISGLESQIDNTQNNIAIIQAQIQSNEVKLAQEKATLDEIIKTMYIGGNLTTLEMLATSKSLSDFATKEEYQNIVQVQIQDTLATINQTQATLKQQNDDLNKVLAGQEAMNAQLSSSESQQSSLLALNQTQQADYTQQLQTNNAQLTVLEEEQAAANAAEAGRVTPAQGNGSGECSIGQGTGPVGDNGVLPANYPDSWCNAAQDSFEDSNGILNRECTSFAFWYFVDIEGNSNFSVSGNAGWWWETASSTNSSEPFTVDTNPQVGAIGVEPSTATSTDTVPSLHDSPTGHVMIVMALPGQTYDGITADSTHVIVASMNEDEAGHFMYNTWPVNDLWYIHPQS